MPSTGVTWNVTPLQVTVLMVVMVASGFTVTVTVNELLKPQAVFGVTIYVAVTAELVVFTSVPYTFADGTVWDTPPVKPTPVGAVHVNKVPEGIIPLIPSVGVTLNIVPLQVIAVIGVIVAPGKMLMVTVNEVPAQFPETGETI